MKFDVILLLRKLKNPWIWILFFRVPKFWLSGLPYLRKPSIDDFLFYVILWFRVLKLWNKSQKSSEHNTRTFSFQASCVLGKVPAEKRKRSRIAFLHFIPVLREPVLHPRRDLRVGHWAVRVRYSGRRRPRVLRRGDHPYPRQRRRRRPALVRRRHR